MKLKTIVSLLQKTGTEWLDDNASRLAAALAYYTVFSLAPLLIIALAIAGSIFGTEAARDELVSQIQSLVGASGAEVVKTALDNASQPDIKNAAGLISVGILLFGASGVFAQLQDALNTIWEVKPKPELGIWNFVRKRILSFSIVLGIGFLLLVSLVVSAGLAALGKYLSGLIPGIDLIWQIVNFVISFGVISCLFAVLFKYLPDVKIEWRDVTIGAVITALLFNIGKWALGLYLGNSGFGSTYGAAGSLVILLAWIYYSAQIMFFGAEFTQVYAQRYGSRIEPDRHAVKIPESTQNS